MRNRIRAYGFFLLSFFLLGVSPLHCHRLYPEDLEYLGAFRLPKGTSRPYTFAYGGEAMTFYPLGNQSPNPDELSGSLFIMGHNRMPYSELPNGNQVAEVSIPFPKKASRIEDLPVARFLQPFSVVCGGLFSHFDEIPRVGMEYHEGKMYLTFGQHFQPEDTPTHAFFSPDLSNPDPKGPWYVGHHSSYSLNGYLFAIPDSWAKEHLGGSFLATGRFRDGGWSGMGPALIAYPVMKDELPPPYSRLPSVPLVLYQSSSVTSSMEHTLHDYQHGDEWSGGAFLTTKDKQAVVFVGTKSAGTRYWYGYLHPTEDYPLIEESMIGEFVLCRYADGTPCFTYATTSDEPLASVRGWWSDTFYARFLFYDPAALALVAKGALAPFEIQPYTHMDVDEYLFLNPAKVEEWMLGTGARRNHRLGDVAYCRERGLLFVLELFSDREQPVVHVWRLKEGVE